MLTRRQAEQLSAFPASTIWVIFDVQRTHPIESMHHYEQAYKKRQN